MMIFSATLPSPRRTFFGLLLALSAVGAHADDARVKIAFVEMHNASSDPRYDYLEGIVRGMLLFDLSNAPGMTVVERSSLDAVLKEQELILSDLVASENAIRVGKMLGADYLLKGNYIFMGNEVRLNLSVIEVVTAKTISFSDAGATENVVHALAERIVERLTGNTVVFRSTDRERSIISLKDETPGSIGLFCNLVDAEVFVDGCFVCYTTGRFNVPVELTGLAPGRHTVRIHLKGFGVVKTPELSLSDWQETVEVKPGQRQVLRATVSLFSVQIMELKKLAWETVKIAKEQFGRPFSKEYDLGFTDRTGKRIRLMLRFTVTASTAETVLTGQLVYDDRSNPLSLSCPAGEKASGAMTVEKVDVSFRLEHHPVKGSEIEFRVFRNDIDEDVLKKK